MTNLRRIAQLIEDLNTVGLLSKDKYEIRYFPNTVDYEILTIYFKKSEDSGFNVDNVACAIRQEFSRYELLSMETDIDNPPYSIHCHIKPSTIE